MLDAKKPLWRERKKEEERETWPCRIMGCWMPSSCYLTRPWDRRFERGREGDAHHGQKWLAKMADRDARRNAPRCHGLPDGVQDNKRPRECTGRNKATNLCKICFTRINGNVRMVKKKKKKEKTAGAPDEEEDDDYPELDIRPERWVNLRVKFVTWNFLTGLDFALKVRSSTRLTTIVDKVK